MYVDDMIDVRAFISLDRELIEYTSSQTFYLSVHVLNTSTRVVKVQRTARCWLTAEEVWVGPFASEKHAVAALKMLL